MVGKQLSSYAFIFKEGQTIFRFFCYLRYPCTAAKVQLAKDIITVFPNLKSVAGQPWVIWL